MTYHPLLTDFVSLPHIVCYYRLMFPHFVFKNMSLKEYAFCHCVYKIYYRSFVLLSKKVFLMDLKCLSILVFFLVFEHRKIAVVSTF